MGLLRTDFATYTADGPAGGGAPAPAPEPAPAAEPEAQGASSDEAFVLDAFDAMQVDDLDTGGMEPVTDSAPATAPDRAAAVSPPPATAVTPPAQTTPAPVEPGAATPPVPAAAAAPAQQPATTTAGPPAEPALAPEKVLEKIHEEVVKHQEIFTQKLAETVYKLPEKELENFNEDPAGVIARVAARVHTNVVSSLTRVLSQQMPVYVHGLLQANDRAAKNESEFWSSNPFLDKAKHEPMVTQIAVMYKQLNPNASRADFIKTVGAMAMGALGLTAQAVGQRTAPGAAPAPPVQTPGRIVRNVPPAFQPAGAHASSAPPAPQQLNEWERMTIALENDSQGAFDT